MGMVRWQSCGSAERFCPAVQGRVCPGGPLPVTSSRPLDPPAFNRADADWIDVIACTHEHLDHLDLGALAPLTAASSRAVVVVPEPIVHIVTRVGIDARRVIGVQPGAQSRFGAWSFMYCRRPTDSNRRMRTTLADRSPADWSDVWGLCFSHRGFLSITRATRSTIRIWLAGFASRTFVWPFSRSMDARENVKRVT